MLRPHGYLVTAGDGRPTEHDTVSCAHCGGHVLVAAGRRVQADDHAGQLPLGWCGRCAAVICAACEARGVCDPFEALLARLEARGRFLRQVDGAAP